MSSGESFALLKGVTREIFALSVEKIHKTDDKESTEVERQEIVFLLAPLPAACRSRREIWPNIRIENFPVEILLYKEQTVVVSHKHPRYGH